MASTEDPPPIADAAAAPIPAPTPAPAPAPAPIPAPATASTPDNDDDEKSCFICLQTAPESPGLAWVTPCPCSLDAHEACMLRWIAETEVANRAGGSQKKKIRCPVCKARIRTAEPYDSLVALGDRIARLQRRVAPSMLLTIVGSMGAAASASYGYQAAVAMVGEPMMNLWLFPDAYTVQTSAAAAGAAATFLHSPAWKKFEFLTKTGVLSMLAPSLLLHRALPSLANFMALPMSATYALALLWIDRHKLPKLRLRDLWPPSPAWVLTAWPLMSIAYATAYYDLFGGLERRLNLALRGTSEDEAEAEAEAQLQELRQAGLAAGGAEQAEAEEAGGGQRRAPAARPADAQPGVLRSIIRLGMTAMHLLGNGNENVQGDDHGNNADRPGDDDEVADPLMEEAMAIDLGMGVNIVVEAVEEVEEGEDDDDDDDDDDEAQEEQQVQQVQQVQQPLPANGEEPAVENAVENAVEEGGDNDDGDDEAAWVDEADNEILPPRWVRDDDMDILGRGRVGGGGGGGAWVMRGPLDNDDDNDGLVAPPPPNIRFGPHGIIELVRPDGAHGAAHGAPANARQQQQQDVVAAAAPLPPVAAPPPPPRNGGGGGSLILAEIVTAITSQLLLPRMAATAGELLALVLPKSWVTPRPLTVADLEVSLRTQGSSILMTATAARRPLLQQRWGRSLVGGLLVIMLRDAWNLLIKYRRVQQKQQRRIRNVERRRNNGDSTTAATADASAAT